MCSIQNDQRPSVQILININHIVLSCFIIIHYRLCRYQGRLWLWNRPIRLQSPGQTSLLPSHQGSQGAEEEEARATRVAGWLLLKISGISFFGFWKMWVFLSVSEIERIDRSFFEIERSKKRLPGPTGTAASSQEEKASTGIWGVAIFGKIGLSDPWFFEGLPRKWHWILSWLFLFGVSNLRDVQKWLVDISLCHGIVEVLFPLAATLGTGRCYRQVTWWSALSGSKVLVPWECDFHGISSLAGWCTLHEGLIVGDPKTNKLLVSLDWIQIKAGAKKCSPVCMLVMVVVTGDGENFNLKWFPFCQGLFYRETTNHHKKPRSTGFAQALSGKTRPDNLLWDAWASFVGRICSKSWFFQGLWSGSFGRNRSRGNPNKNRSGVCRCRNSSTDCEANIGIKKIIGQ